MTKIADITGEVFGRLTAIRIDHREPPKTYWLCRCRCGKEMVTTINDLNTGHTRSCGCLKRDSMRRVATVHGLYNGGKYPDGYSSWQSILRRCYTKTNEHYKYYGGRGITVCDQWRGPMGVVVFLKDMGLKPTPNHTVGRIDSNGPYCPENCRWETDLQQGQNTRRTKNYTFDGITLCISAWARRIGISLATMRNRFAKWSVERAITEPVSKRGRKSQRKSGTPGDGKGSHLDLASEWELTG